MRTISPFLWFDTQAEDAAKHYVSIFGNSKMKEIDIAALRKAHNGH